MEDDGDFWDFVETKLDDGKEVVAKLRNEKVDPDVIVHMNDDELKHYVTHHGDRVRIRAFLQERQRPKRRKEKKNKLLSILKEKLDSRKKRKQETASSEEDDEMKTKKNVGNRNAEKKTRKLKLGWIHQKMQVREKKGGGTRVLDFPKEATKTEIIEEGKRLFFPKGVSSKGPLSDFQVNLLDFGENEVEQGKTLGTMYSETKLPVMRFYFATTDRSYSDDDNNHDNDSSSDSLPLISDIAPVLSQTSSEQPPPLSLPAPLQNASSSTRTSMDNLSDSESLPDIQPPKPRQAQSSSTMVTSSPQASAYSPMDILSTAVMEAGIDLDDFDDKHPVNLNFDSVLPLQSRPSGIKRRLVVHRGHVLKELIKQFVVIDPKCDIIVIDVKMPNGESEAAEDGGGVSRDVLTEFWTSFYDECTVGNSSKIPTIRHDFGEEEWQAVAKIVHYGWKTVGYFPVQISKTFMQQCMFNTITEDLTKAFLAFLPAQDADTIKEALQDMDSVDKNELIEILEPYGLKTNLTRHNIGVVVEQIAHAQIVQESMFITRCWTSTLSHLNISPEQLESLYDEMVPTPRRVLHIMNFPETTSQEESNVCGYMKRFIRELDNASSLKNFLRFCTGSDLIIGRRIDVSFVGVSGFARRPIAHTCSCLLELPKTYEGYPQFKAEFMAVLNAGVWVMDII